MYAKTAPKVFLKPFQRLNNHGMSLVELIVALATIGFIVLLLNNLPASMSLITKSRHESIAREIVAKQIEDKRAVAYANLALGSQNISDSRLQLLPGSAGTILIEDCPNTVCTQGEAAKQITVALTWKEGPKDAQVAIKTLIAEGGLNQ